MIPRSIRRFLIQCVPRRQYLHALQLLVFIIHPIALPAALKFTSYKWDELEPLHVILTETFRLTEWGHYAAYYYNKKLVLQKLIRQVIAAVQHLRKENTDSFADGITDCYRYSLIRCA